MKNISLADAVVPPHAPFSGPYLAAALITERILTEKDNNAKSLIRLVDKMNVTLEEVLRLRKGQVISLNASVFISLRATDGYRGESTLLLVDVSPDGLTVPIGIAALEFKGVREDQNDVEWPLTLTWHGRGRYRFDVYLDDKLLTQMPFEIIIEPTQPESEGKSHD